VAVVVVVVAVMMMMMVMVVVVVVAAAMVMMVVVERDAAYLLPLYVTKLVICADADARSTAAVAVERTVLNVILDFDAMKCVCATGVCWKWVGRLGPKWSRTCASSQRRLVVGMERPRLRQRGKRSSYV
jgi:hypothetical protein